MSASEIACPTCGTSLQLPPDSTASRFRCLQCQSVFGLPTVPAAPPPAPVPVAVVAYAPAPAPVLDIPEPEEDEVEPRPTRSRDRDEDSRESRRPAYTRRNGPREPIPKSQIILTILVGVLLLVGLGVGAYFAVRETPKETVKTEPPPKARPKVEPKVENLTPEQMIRKVKTSTVYVRTHLKGGYVGSGTGFFAGKPGYIVTNAHVIGYGPANIRVPTRVEVVVGSGENDERTFVAKVFGVDADEDLAVLQIEGRSLPVPLAFGKSEDLVETQEVVAFGYPFGELLGKNVSVNRTTVSSLRKVNGSVSVVQLAGGLNPGNSGGPVANAKGEVIGVSVSKLRGSETIAFAIPAETADRFVLDQIERGGQIRTGLLTVTESDPDTDPRSKLPK